MWLSEIFLLLFYCKSWKIRFMWFLKSCRCIVTVQIYKIQIIKHFRYPSMVKFHFYLKWYIFFKQTSRNKHIEEEENVCMFYIKILYFLKYYHWIGPLGRFSRRAAVCCVLLTNQMHFFALPLALKCDVRFSGLLLVKFSRQLI